MGNVQRSRQHRFYRLHDFVKSVQRTEMTIL